MIHPYSEPDEEDPVIAIRNALQDLAFGHVRPLEDVLREAKKEVQPAPQVNTSSNPVEIDGFAVCK